MLCSLRTWVVALVVGVSGSGWGQGVAAGPDRPQPRAGEGAAKDTFAAEPLVVERFDTAYRYKDDGTGEKLDTETARIQNEAGVRALGVINVSYAARRERVEFVYVRVRKRNGTVVETPVADVQDQVTTATRVDPQYSDSHIARLAVRGLAVGDRLEFQVRTVFTAAQAKGEFWAFAYLEQGPVTLQRTLELRVPTKRNVLVDSPGHPPQLSEDGGDKVFRWTGSQLRATLPAKTPGQASGEGGPEQERPAVAWTTFPNWAGVADWYRSLTAVSAQPAPAVKAKAEAIVYGARTPEARIDALYRFVSSGVRSIDVPLGAGHYGALPADQVLANLYGDSQDKSALLVALLHAEGLPAEVVLAGTGPVVDEGVPSPAWFNRALVLTHDPAHPEVWLDTMPEVGPYRYLDRPLRGRLALVVPQQGQAALRRTPADAPFAEFSQFEATGTLSETGELSAQIKVSLRGGDEVLYRQGLRNLGPAQWDRVSAYYGLHAGLTGQPSNTVADAPDSTEAPLHLSYNWQRAEDADWESFRLVPLLPGLDLPYAGRKTAPRAELELSKRKDAAVSRTVLPAGFSADLPAALHVDTPFARLETTYRLDKDGGVQALVVERMLEIKADQLPASEWTAYRAFLDAAAKSNPVLQLTAVTPHTGPGHYPPAAGENNPQAAALIGEAEEAMTAKDWTGAEAKLDAARALHETQPLLWSAYATVALGRSKPDEAVDDLRRELKLHPGEAAVSHRLAGLLQRQGKTAEAVAVLRAALEADPQDGLSARFLANLLGTTDPAAAEKVLRTGLGAAPESLALKLALGDVLLRTGKREEAVRVLTEVAQNSADPEQMNDAAYALAGAGTNLPVAEQAARRALQLLNAAAARGSNGVGGLTELRRSEALVSTWDTYGWVLDREGSFSEAEPWLRAAWADSLSFTSGTHLARLLQQQGKAGEAAHVTALAAQGERGDDDGDASEASAGTPPARSKRPVAASKGAGLEAERTFSLPRTPGSAPGTALVELDYWLGGPTVGRFVSGDPALEGMVDEVAHLNTRTLIPPGSVGHLLRRGELTCGAGPVCSFRLLSPPAAVRTAE